MTETYLTVTALTKYIKHKFEADPYLERVFLTGEISNFRMRPNAHQYFSLKDDKAKISAIMFKGAFNKLKFQPEEGMKVLVIGRISLYEPGGSYQIYIEHMEPDGVGALYQALEKRKKALQEEGLFKEAFKQPLVKYPKKIAVITSPSGAVVKDIITTTKRRYPIVQLVVFPTLVQGDKAADDIVKRIKEVDALGDFDTMIVGRGGGSIEDLWPFNEERVVRAIFESRTPTISSVGHETDVTLADLVADVRAATPTAAAELATPVLREEILKIKEKESRLIQGMDNQIKHKKQKFDHLSESFVFKQPKRLYEAFSIQLDTLNRRLEQSLNSEIKQKEKEFIQLVKRLETQNPKEDINLARQKVNYLNEKLTQSIDLTMKDKKRNLIQLMTNLDMLSPLQTMLRGYSYVTIDDQIIKSTNDVDVKQVVNIHLSDGEVTAEIQEKMPKGE
ncbi:exodeoxyribonuclease VII large subunit [Vagococcus fluvialis]|uniref:Exodeoxyribonuclease 7 large subunit n=1 Tax=Vagococcus fluvialis TaxID=2738 RepID=A0A369AX86_9ENTE|nr:exodeoxyribonuclease VII large subunit [Vagococcus fluvialis]RCX13771.1 exodeoxyribonuclease VII large subunit [Vagococcus fluvialis]RSU02347.1 exodeoxyribonuclease VII large subunit [Vagococcus fluvialis]UDM70803.1 exodeoxyribonuclease VII large subunit [Vagococcus fluvialis]UDM74002.1 exodeoxyribonuclease VII large subunit [Vagococcus fluvialis]UDM75659.1 exodeoxyribonuclease VII large subunit [Vagococcus fluvialis]